MKSKKKTSIPVSTGSSCHTGNIQCWHLLEPNIEQLFVRRLGGKGHSRGQLQGIFGSPKQMWLYKLDNSHMCVLKHQGGQFIWYDFHLWGLRVQSRQLSFEQNAYFDTLLLWVKIDLPKHVFLFYVASGEWFGSFQLSFNQIEICRSHERNLQTWRMQTILCLRSMVSCIYIYNN